MSALISAVRARNGDLTARKIFEEMGENLGYAVSSLVNTWQPDIVVFGGGISLASDLFLPSVRKIISKYKYGDWALKIPLVPAEFGSDAGIYGAALMAANKNKLKRRR